MRKIQFVENNIYHIYNRGVEKRSIFKDDNDRWRFLQGLLLFNDVEASINLLWQIERAKGKTTFKTIKDFLKDKGEKRVPLVRIMADCLMPNHYHLLLEEIRENGISRFMQKLGTGYVKYFNGRHGRVGPLFQGPFKAALVDKDNYLEQLLVYINVVNPGQLVEPDLKEKGVKDINKIMDFAEEYPWSTNQEYLGKRNSIIIDKGLLGELFAKPSDYRDLVKTSLLKRKFAKIGDLAIEN